MADPVRPQTRPAGFPKRASLTITNYCNLRCKMCGQWSEEGYVRADTAGLKNEMPLDDWKRVVDELAAHDVKLVFLRGGELFMYPGIVELLDHMHDAGMRLSIDTNGTMLDRFAADLVRIGDLHLTISVDGPEPIHDAVRGVPGTFRRVKAGLAALEREEAAAGRKVSRSICFTISQYSYKGLGVMPDVARDLGIHEILIVPYYYFPESVGRRYAKELAALDCTAYSWLGFHHEEAGVDFDEFMRQLRRYKATLGEVREYPYLALDEDQFRAWFADARTQVGPARCQNVESLIDIQPDGSANFCVDFIDYSFGNVREDTIEQLWNGDRAERFRELRRSQPLAVCYRCGAKFMSQPWSEYN